MISEPVPLLAALAALVAVSEWLARRTVLRHLGAALLVIVLTAVAANARLVPTFEPDAPNPVYSAIFSHIAPLGIFWLLLLVDLRSVRRVGGPTLLLFVIGAVGTLAGALLAAVTVGGEDALGPRHHAIAGMFVGTYVGGSVNFNAVALEYGVAGDAAVYAGAAAVDNAMTTLWMAVGVAMPRVLAKVWPARATPVEADPTAHLPVDDEVETATVFDMAIVVCLGLATVAGSGQIAELIEAQTGIGIPSALVLTTIALVLAQSRFVQRLRGARLLGLFSIYFFLAVIGALCDIGALVRVGALAPVLAAFVGITVAVHGITTYGAAYLLRIDAETASVASQANIGGGTSALALARSLGRGDLELPAILVGSLGVAAGNYLGFATAGWLAS